MSGLKRGTLLLASGWGVQLVTGYLLNSWLGQRLGPEAYGTYGVVMAVLLWVEVGAISGIPTAVQKFTAASQDQAAAILKAANRAQGVFVALLFGAAMALAPQIAVWMDDTTMTAPLRLALLDIWVYSYFFIYMSLQNGFRRCGMQALLVAIYAVAKLAGVYVLVGLWGRLEGALAANIGGSVVGLVLAWIVWRGLEKPVPSSKAFERGALLRFAAPVALFSLTINLFLNVDLWMVKAFCLSVDPGYYTAASTIARIPYYLFFGLSATVLPSVSTALAQKDEVGARQTVSTAIRILLLLVLPLCALLWFWAEPAVTLLFGAGFAPAGAVLRVLVMGHSLLALLFLLTTVLNAANVPRRSLLVTAFAALVDVALLLWLTPRYGMTGAAVATVVSLTLGCLAAGWVVWKRFPLRVHGLSLVRIFVAVALVGLAAWRLPVHGLTLVGAGLALFILYGGVLWITGELGDQPFRLLKNKGVA